MTKNQIEYGKLLEQRRTNLSNEDLTRRRDTLQAQARFVELREQGRHNLASEQIQSGSLDESIRHNRATESVQTGQLEEARRHNLAQENVQTGQLSELRRHNQATEQAQLVDLGIKRDSQQESVRHNQQVESISRYDADTRRAQLGIARAQVAVAQRQADASIMNAETNRMQQLEAARHNVIQEQVSLQDAATRQTQVIGQLNLGRDRLSEDKRHAQVVELETGRHNVTTETETQRHNTASEFIEGLRAAGQLTQTAMNAATRFGAAKIIGLG